MLHAKKVRTLDTSKTLADFLNVSNAQIRKMCRTTNIPVIRVGCSVRFDREAVLEWLKKKGK